MQSPTAVMLRTFVMLFCLIAVPLAALFGNALPGIVRNALDGHLPAGWDWRTKTTSEAPRFDPSAPAPAPTATAGDAAVPAWHVEATAEAAGPAKPRAAQADPAVVPAGYEAPVVSIPTAPPSPAAIAAAQAMPTPPPPAPGALAPPDAARGPDARPAAAGTMGDQFSYIQDRLKQLGATYYLLESWGSQQQMYRFYCKMAVGGNADYTRYFEATDVNPLQAMGQVLQQVESWRAAGR